MKPKFLATLATLFLCTCAHEPTYRQTGFVERPSPVLRQETEVWCWAATAASVLDYLGYPNANPAGNYQCGVVALTFPQCDADCFRCIVPIGPMTNMVSVLHNYVRRVSPTGPRADFQPTYIAHPSFDTIADAIDRGYLVIAGISPNTAPYRADYAEHVVLITGYAVEDRPNSTGYYERSVIVNDPFIYHGWSPYDRPGASVSHSTGKGLVDWNVFRNQLRFTSAVFVNPRGSGFEVWNHN